MRQVRSCGASAGGAQAILGSGSLTRAVNARVVPSGDQASFERNGVAAGDLAIVNKDLGRAGPLG